MFPQRIRDHHVHNRCERLLMYLTLVQETNSYFPDQSLQNKITVRIMTLLTNAMRGIDILGKCTTLTFVT